MATIKEHKEQMAVAIDSLNQEISKSKDYVDSNSVYFQGKSKTLNNIMQLRFRKVKYNIKRFEGSARNRDILPHITSCYGLCWRQVRGGAAGS